MKHLTPQQVEALNQVSKILDNNGLIYMIIVQIEGSNAGSIRSNIDRASATQMLHDAIQFFSTN